MAISGIDSLNNIANISSNSDTKVTKDTGSAFDSLFSSAVNMYSEADSYQKKAEEAEMNFAMGYSDNTHDLALAQQKANISLQYTVKVTNKALEAYKEIMNMQI